MRIFFASSCAPPEESPVVREFERIAMSDRVGIHKPVKSPDSADLILFVDNNVAPDWRRRAMLEHPLLARYPEKCMVYDEGDRPWNALPGVYMSMPKEFFDPGSQRAWAYRELYENTALKQIPRTADVLYSFLGRHCRWGTPGSRVRREIFTIRDDRAIIHDSSQFLRLDGTGGARGYNQRQEERYAELLGRSKFILCPRGLGTSSYRLYETLRAGRVPVVLSDGWVPPVGPEWEKFAILVPEKHVTDMPGILRAAEPRWEEMAAGALQAWEQWFAPAVNFHHLVEQLQSLLLAKPLIDLRLQSRRYNQLRRFYLLRGAYRRIRGLCGCA